jgi:hypothetical protein
MEELLKLRVAELAHLQADTHTKSEQIRLLQTQL